MLLSEESEDILNEGLAELSGNVVDEPQSEESEQLDDEQIEVEIPDWIPDNLVPNQSFASPSEELEWYRNSYVDVIEQYKSPEFGKALLEKYEASLSATEAEHEKLMSIKAALEGNPEAALSHFFPDALTSRGYITEITGDKATQWISSKLEAEFGEDYAENFNPDQANKPGTLSYKMLQAQERITKELDKTNERNREWEARNRPLSQEEVYNKVNQQYEADWKGVMDRESFDVFIQEVDQAQFDLRDFHRALYFENYMQRSKEIGIAEGRKLAIAELKKSGSAARDIPNSREREAPASYSREAYVDPRTQNLLNLFTNNKRS